MKKLNRSHCMVALAGLALPLLCIGVIRAQADIPVDTIPTVPTITNSYMTLSPDGEKLYVSRRMEDRHFIRGDVVVIDTKEKKHINTIPLGPGVPLEIDLTSDGKLAFVAISKHPRKTSGENRVEFIDTETNTIAKTVYAGEARPTGLAVTPNDKKVYVTSRGPHTVEVIDVDDVMNGRTEYPRPETRIPVPPGPVGIDITPDGRWTYVASRRQLQANTTGFGDKPKQETMVSVIDTSVTSKNYNKVCVKIRVPAGGGTHTTDVAVTPDEDNKVYISYYVDNNIAVIDIGDIDIESCNGETVTLPQSTTVTTCSSTDFDEEDCPQKGLREIVVTPDGEQALVFVVAEKTNEIIVFRRRINNFHTLVGSIPVGPSPFDIKLQDLSVAYVSVDNAVKVLDLDTFTADLDIKPGLE